MKKKLFFFLIISSLSFTHAQEGGSIYSKFGLGYIYQAVNSKSLGMGGTNLAFFDSYEINNFNPASWSLLKNTSFSAGAYFENTTLTNSYASKSYDHFNFRYSIIGIPIDKEKKIVAGLGLEPISKIGYNTVVNQPFGDLNPQITYNGDGGISGALFGITYSPLPDFYFGIKTDYLFGSIRHLVKVNYNNEDYFNNEVSRNILTRGFNFTAGLIYSGLGKIFNVSVFNLGLIFSPPVNIKAEQELSSIYLLNGASTSLDTTIISNGSLKVPGTFGFGFNMVLNERFGFGADYIFQNWTGFNILDAKYNEIKNSQKVSVGAELLPNREAGGKLINGISYRMGFYFNKLNLQIQNTNINEFGVSLGLGLPISINSNLNVSLTYGQRGTKNNNLILEKFYLMQFSFNVGELWFVSPDEP